ncbi:hypothetical protein AB0E88_24140 [Streptomyces sp. NPDC028635]|uniref:hypothetical protein n=1 Tax=Streptomyces sp. NPDC028635 TaxID=3154800 RepID=UPI0033F7A77B
MRMAKLGGGVCLALLLTGCGGAAGGAKGSDTTEPSASASPSPVAVPAADKGPECEGAKDAEGLHLLRGGVTVVPGAGAVTYARAGADGTRRSAGLSVAGHEQTVAVGQKVTLKGRTFTVAQICTYRVVLTTADHQGANQGASMAKWPTTHDGHWRLRWHVPDNGPGTGAVVTDIEAPPARAAISVTAVGKGQLAFYDDVREGGTVEIAGRLWKVETIDAGRMDVEMNSPDFRAGYVDLRDLGAA